MPLNVPWSKLVVLGMVISWVSKPLRTWVDEFIPYYMEIMGVDRPSFKLTARP